MVNLVGKVCLVTGASRGIGKGIALQLAQTGATVYITGRNAETLNHVVAEMKERGATKAYGVQGTMVYQNYRTVASIVRPRL